MMSVSDWKQGFVVGVVAGAGFVATVSCVWKLQRKRTAKAARRIGGVCKLKKGFYDQYTQLHDHTWDEVMERMYKSNIRNFLVYYHEETDLMFSHFEYVGKDFDADMGAIAADPIVIEWWSYCEPCQEPFHWSGPPPSQGGTGGKSGAWWDPLICLNHCGAWPIEYSCVWPDPEFTPNNPRGATSTRTTPPPVHNRK